MGIISELHNLFKFRTVLKSHNDCAKHFMLLMIKKRNPNGVVKQKSSDTFGMSNYAAINWDNISAYTVLKIMMWVSFQKYTTYLNSEHYFLTAVFYINA